MRYTRILAVVMRFSRKNGNTRNFDANVSLSFSPSAGRQAYCVLKACSSLLLIIRNISVAKCSAYRLSK